MLMMMELKYFLSSVPRFHIIKISSAVLLLFLTSGVLEHKWQANLPS